MEIMYYSMANDSPMYTWQENNFIDELGRHGVNVTVFNPLCFEGFDAANEQLIRQLQDQKYDLFMTCHNESVLYIDTLRRIRTLGLPMLLICFDNLLIPFEHRKVAKYFDLVWLTSKDNEKMFVKWGAKTMFMPYAANPDFYRVSRAKEISRIVFLGTPYGSRTNTINSLVEHDLPVSLYGKTSGGAAVHHYTKGFAKTLVDDMRFPIGRKLLAAAAKQRIVNHPALKTDSPNLSKEGFAERIDEVYSTYALALSTTSARNTGILKDPVPVVNLRSFEIPMSGGIQFCRFNRELSGYFEEGKEIVFYRSTEEMVEKGKYYLREDKADLRRTVREAARRRAENEHTWYLRFSKIFSVLGI